jgi:hypothetical protein
MSLKVMTWAWALPLPPTPKFVLMALADEADDSGYCFPSHGRIAKKCSVNERTVRRMISVLSAGGYLAIKRRFNNRARTSNGYQLLIDHPRTNCPGPLDTHVRIPTTYPLIYPQPPQPVHRKATRATAGSPADEAASRGGLCFPRNLSTAQTRELARSLADKALRLLACRELLSCIRRHCPRATAASTILYAFRQPGRDRRAQEHDDRLLVLG